MGDLVTIGAGLGGTVILALTGTIDARVGKTLDATVATMRAIGEQVVRHDEQIQILKEKIA